MFAHAANKAAQKLKADKKAAILQRRSTIKKERSLAKTSSAGSFPSDKKEVSGFAE